MKAAFNPTPDEQRCCADDINRWLAEKKLQSLRGRALRLAEAAAAHRLLEENSVHKAGAVAGKIVRVP